MNSFVFNHCLKSKTHGSHQMLFPPFRCSASRLLQTPFIAVCSWVSLHSVLSSVTEKHVSFLLKSGHSLGHWIILHIFALRNSYFAWCFASLTIWIFRLCSINFYSIKLNWYREYHPAHFRIIFLLLLSAGHITQFHWQPYMPICNLPPPCLKWCYDLVLLHNFLIPSFWYEYQVTLGFICQNFSVLVFLFFIVTNGL